MPDIFATTLYLQVRASYWHSTLVIASYSAACAVCVVLALTRPMLCLLLPAIALGGLLAWRRARLRDARAVRRLRWHADDEWRWQLADGTWQDGDCVRAQCFGSTLVILTLRSRGRRDRRRRCVLFADSLDADSHRRLRVRLRVTPPEGSPSIAGV